MKDQRFTSLTRARIEENSTLPADLLIHVQHLENCIASSTIKTTLSNQ